MSRLLLPSPLPLLLHRPSSQLHSHPRRRRGCIPNAASNGGQGSGEPSPATTDTTAPSTPPPPSSSSPTGVKNRLRARNQARRAQPELDAPPAPVRPEKKRAPAAAAAARQRGPKEWEEMSLGEKALELYVGEKGLLFWLNKFAYASIFIMVGAWVLFRFVGPSLGLYQLDAPPLPPTAVFGGSP